MLQICQLLCWYIKFEHLPALPNGHSKKLELEQIKVNELHAAFLFRAKETLFLKCSTKLSVEFFNPTANIKDEVDN